MKLAIFWTVVWMAFGTAWLMVFGKFHDHLSATKGTETAALFIVGALWGVFASFIYRNVLRCLEWIRDEAEKARQI
jgi:hypothetical protein